MGWCRRQGCCMAPVCQGSGEGHLLLLWLQLGRHCRNCGGHLSLPCCHELGEQGRLHRHGSEHRRHDRQQHGRTQHSLHPGVGAKQAAWLAHCAVVGAVIAPICLLGGPIPTRAAWYTAGMVGGLSTVAVCAPSDKFLYMGGPLAMGLGVVFCASIASNFLPPTPALGAGMYSIAVYGGLVLFGAFLLYDTQKVIHKAEHHPAHYGAPPFDPVNASIGIYMDTVNIFIRIAMMLANGVNRRK